MLKKWGFVAGLMVLVSIATAQTIPFENTDTLAEIEQKIAINGYAFTVAPNWVTQLSPAEREKLRSRRPSKMSAHPTDSLDYGPLQQHLGRELPAQFDWRNRQGNSYIGPIRQQGECGACYAFSTAAAAESSYNIAHGLVNEQCRNFSEAFIAFCLGEIYSEHFSGCEGADFDYMEMEAMTREGVPDENAFPYDQNLTACQSSAWEHPRVVFESWHRVPCQDINAIKTAIMTYGVVNAAVLVSSAFGAYQSGVYEDSNTECDASPCWYAQTDHAIALVGWNDTDNPQNGYWILRNSWGTNWGIDGYMHIRYHSARVSCAVCYLVYDSGSATPQPTSTPDVSSSPTPALPTNTPEPTVPGTPPPGLVINCGDSVQEALTENDDDYYQDGTQVKFHLFSATQPLPITATLNPNGFVGFLALFHSEQGSPSSEAIADAIGNDEDEEVILEFEIETPGEYLIAVNNFYVEPLPLPYTLHLTCTDSPEPTLTQTPTPDVPSSPTPTMTGLPLITPTPVPGDLNGDGKVDNKDLLILMQWWGKGPND